MSWGYPQYASRFLINGEREENIRVIEGKS